MWNMYYKIYRRRNKLYIIIGAILLIFLYFDKNKSAGNERKDNLNDLDDLFKVIEEKLDNKPKKRYIPPAPCEGCPGEDGAGVTLTVRRLYDFLLFCFTCSIINFKA